MRRAAGRVELSASDLSQFLACRRRTALDLAVAHERLRAPVWRDPAKELLQERGLAKLEADTTRIAADLDTSWEVLAEAVQTVMRRHGVTDAYEQLKALTRGRPVTRELLHEFIEAAAIPPGDRKRLLALTPAGYVGRSAELARKI